MFGIVITDNDETSYKYNFQQRFIKYMCTIYNSITSAVINNGEISEWFYPKQGWDKDAQFQHIYLL